MKRKESHRKLRPTIMGWYFSGLIVVLLLLSISYSNNLLLIFALLFLSLEIIWATESFFFNKDLLSKNPELRNVFADENIVLDELEGTELRFYSRETEINIRERLRRGLVQIDKIKVKTARPFGLFEFTEIKNVDLQFYVYPARMRTWDRPVTNESGDTNGNLPSKDNKEDLAGLARYQDGNQSRIHWKHFAKTHELVMKEMEGNSDQRTLLELLDNSNEETLSNLAAEIYQLKLTNKKILLKVGDENISDYHEALKRLALW